MTPLIPGENKTKTKWVLYVYLCFDKEKSCGLTSPLSYWEFYFLGFPSNREQQGNVQKMQKRRNKKDHYK